MKTCLLCNSDAPDDAATCPNDGEASWSLGSPPSAIVTVPDVSGDGEDAPKRASRRAPK